MQGSSICADAPLVGCSRVFVSFCSPIGCSSYSLMFCLSSPFGFKGNLPLLAILTTYCSFCQEVRFRGQGLGVGWRALGGVRGSGCDRITPTSPPKKQTRYQLKTKHSSRCYPVDLSAGCFPGSSQTRRLDWVLDAPLISHLGLCSMFSFEKHMTSDFTVHV